MRSTYLILALVALSGCAHKPAYRDTFNWCHDNQDDCRRELSFKSPGSKGWGDLASAYCMNRFEDSQGACEAVIGYAMSKGLYSDACVGYTGLCNRYGSGASCQLAPVACKAAEKAKPRYEVELEAKLKRAEIRQRQQAVNTQGAVSIIRDMSHDEDRAPAQNVRIQNDNGFQCVNCGN